MVEAHRFTDPEGHTVSEARIHRAVSDDGTEIVGTVHGHGPPLVLVHGGMDDGTTVWLPCVPLLADRFTCHIPSLRNRGRSGHSEDLSPPRLVEDVVAYASSLGEPVGLVGVSLGGALVLGAAARLQQVTAVVAYEPAIAAVMNEDVRNQFIAVVTQKAEEAEQGRLDAGVRIFLEFVANADEVAALDASGAPEAMAPNVPADLALIQQGMGYSGPRATDASELAKITAPVLLLQGRRTNIPAWFQAGVRHVTDHVPQAIEHEFEDLGHLATAVAPKPVADEIARFFDRVLQPS